MSTLGFSLLFWLNFLKWRKILKKSRFLKKWELNLTCSGKRNPSGLGREGRGEREWNRDAESSQWVSEHMDGAMAGKNTQPLWAVKYPRLHRADHRTTLSLGTLVGVKAGEGCHSLKLDAVSTDETEVCLRTAAPVASIQAWDMLYLILLAIVNSQNTDHLFPGFLTALLPGLSAQRGWQSPEQVFPLLTSSKTPKAAHQTCTVSKIIKPMDSNLQQHESNQTHFGAMKGEKWPDSQTC